MLAPCAQTGPDWLRSYDSALELCFDKLQFQLVDFQSYVSALKWFHLLRATKLSFQPWLAQDDFQALFRAHARGADRWPNGFQARRPWIADDEFLNPLKPIHP